MSNTCAQKKLEIANWCDKYTARFDQELTTAWPDLAQRLREKFGKLSIWELGMGPGEKALSSLIDPVVTAWVARHVQPIIEDAIREFPGTIQCSPDVRGLDNPNSPPVGGMLETLDVLKGLALPAGVMIGGGSLAIAIVTTTKLLIITTTVVYWPLLITGLVIGAALSWIGVVNLAQMKDRFQARFTNHLLPKIGAAIAGQGTEIKGQHVPSLMEQLKQQIRDVATNALKSVGCIP
jgi:hypothetical protein